MDPNRPVEKRYGAYLPHWSQEGATYFVTFRLGDSLPRDVVVRLKTERAELLNRARKAEGGIAPRELARIKRLFSEKVDRYLDAGRGSCWMTRPEAAKVVAEALTHFDGDRYGLVAWSVMPNHVHAVFQPWGLHRLEGVLHSWKSFTSRRINKAVGRSGRVWQPEYFDHLIRGVADLEHAIQYTQGNPQAAGLRNWTWVGGSAVARASRP